ncbi:MAG: restriction endonuclease subunit S [Shewanella sp.]
MIARVPLAKIAQINPRLPKDTDESQHVSFLAMASVSEDGRILDQETRVLAETKKGYTYFERGDVLLAKITPCFENGKAALVDNLEYQIGYGSTEFHVLRADPELLDSKYLFYMVWSDRFRFFGEKSMQGAAGQKRVSADFLKQFEIPLPPLAEQKRIAAILDKADALRRKRQQAIELADQFLRSVFLDMFGDPVTNPKGWDVKQLKEISRVITGNTPPRQDPENYGSSIEWIKSDNINTPHHYLTEANEYLSDEGLKKGRSVPSGSVLITCIAGSLHCIGNAAIADRKVAFNQQINALLPEQEVTTEYLYSLVLFGKKLIQDASTNSMKGMVSKGNLEKLYVPVPPKVLQKKYSEVFKEFLYKRKRQISSLEQSESLFLSLGQQAFRGLL